MSLVDAPAGALISSTGAVAVTRMDRTASELAVEAKVLRTGETFAVTAKPAPAAKVAQSAPANPAAGGLEVGLPQSMREREDPVRPGLSL